MIFCLIVSLIIAEKMSRGKFIVIEGADKVGKTTSALQLVSKLREEGLPAVYISFPKTWLL